MLMSSLSLWGLQMGGDGFDLSSASNQDVMGRNLNRTVCSIPLRTAIHTPSRSAIHTPSRSPFLAVPLGSTWNVSLSGLARSGSLMSVYVDRRRFPHFFMPLFCDV